MKNNWTGVKIAELYSKVWNKVFETDIKLNRSVSLFTKLILDITLLHVLTKFPLFLPNTDFSPAPSFRRTEVSLILQW